MSRQTFLNRWASGGAKTDPGSVKTAIGFIAEDPPYQWQNWWQARVDEMMAHLEEQGVSDWLITTPYLAGGLAIGSDRTLYRAVVANTGIDPVSDAGSNWLPLVRLSTQSNAGVVELATDQETIDGLDATRAVTPAGLSARTATRLRAGIIEIANDPEVFALSPTETFRAITPSALGKLLATTLQAGITKFATAQEAVEGIVSDKAVTPQSLGSLAASIAPNGYQTFVGELILQWGTTNASNGLGVDYPLPISFPNNFFACACGGLLTNAGGGVVPNAAVRPGQGIGFELSTINIGSIGAFPVPWVAIGN